MSSTSSDLKKNVDGLRTRFPEAEGLVEEALHASNNDVRAATNLLIEWGCKQVVPAQLPPLYNPPSQALPRPPPRNEATSSIPPPVSTSSAPAAPLSRPPIFQPPPGPPPQHIYQPPPGPPPQHSVFDGFDPRLVQEALDRARGDQQAAIEILLSPSSVVPPPSAFARPPSFPPPSLPPPSLPPPSLPSPSVVPPPSLPPSVVLPPSLPPVSAPVSPPSSLPPASMLSSTDIVKQVEALSLKEYEEERRARKIHVFVDLSNVAIGAQVGPDGKRDTSVRINVQELVRCVHQDRDVKGRHVITSVAGTLDKQQGKKPSFIQDWADLGYEVRVQERRGGSEQFLDETLMVPMMETVRRFGSAKLGSGPGRKQHTLVLLSGDGNSNGRHHSFAEIIQDALSEGMFVEIWAWRSSASRVYTQEFIQHYGSSFSIHYFDNYRDQITRKFEAHLPPASAAAAASMAPIEEEDDDWMVCPITCEVITDAAATKFAPKRYYERQSLEEWVQASGTCPLTRRACTLHDILSCKTEMQARIRQRSAASLAARRPIDAAGGAEAGGEQERTKWAQYTVTLQTTDWSIFAAMPKELIRQTMRQQLPVHVAKALATTGPTAGKSAKDFLFLNFVSVEAAREAIAHVNDALAGSVKFGDKTHKVKAEWDKRTRETHAALIDQAPAPARAASSPAAVPSKESKLPPAAQQHDMPAPASQFESASSAKIKSAPRAYGGSPPPQPAPLFFAPSPAAPWKTKEENLLKVRDCCVDLTAYEQEFRSRWPGVKYCSVNKKKVLRIGFHTPEAFSAAQTGVAAATIVIEPRTDALHDEHFVTRDLAEHGFKPYLLSVSPMTRRRFMLCFVHPDVVQAAAQFLEAHTLFQVKRRPVAAALPGAERSF